MPALLILSLWIPPNTYIIFCPFAVYCHIRYYSGPVGKYSRQPRIYPGIIMKILSLVYAENLYPFTPLLQEGFFQPTIFHNVGDKNVPRTGEGLNVLRKSELIRVIIIWG